MNHDVDAYLVDGCGRCELYKTPQCKVHTWAEELRELRDILLQFKLEEEIKWSVPCYVYKGKNVLMLSALKDAATISFFKGSLLKDPEKLLSQPGKNSQAARYLKITSQQQVHEFAASIKAFVSEAIQLELAGSKVDFKEKNELIYPEELLQKMEESSTFKKAFEALTPGRQRGYILHFTQPKQSKTRVNRIDKWMPTILNGKGMHDEYRSKK